jgi:hypothetical protein
VQKYSRTGGILTIVAGCFSIFYFIMGIVYMLLPQLMESAVATKNAADSKTVMMIFTIIGAGICLFALVAGVLSITGGIFGLKRKKWAIALAGAISAALLFFPIGIIATVLTSMGHLEFNGSASDSLTTTGQDSLTNARGVN